jgi:transcriptional regulator with XRE-family HTH domain
VDKSKSDLVASSVVRLLQAKRVALGLSMNEVAKRARLSHSMISRVEHELRRPTLDTLLRISVAIGVELWPLIKDAEKDTSLSNPKNE